MPRFLRDLPGRPTPLNPPADRCYEKSLELAPDLVETYEGLIQHHLENERPGYAEKAARKLLERHPDHIPTLLRLANLRREKDPAEALELLQRALKNNPLDRRLREQVGVAHMQAARPLALAGKIEEARPHYQAALGLMKAEEHHTIYCRWAAAELKAGEAEKAEEALTQARARSAAPVQVAFVMLTEVGRLKLPPAVKKRFDQEFKDALAEPLVPAAAAATGQYAASLAKNEVQYHGIKTHLKKVQTWLEKSRGTPYTEEQMHDVCQALVALGSKRAARNFLFDAQHQFPTNPFFPYLEVLSYWGEDEDEPADWRLQGTLKLAERLARALPKDDRIEALLADIERRLRTLAAFNPFGGPLQGMFEAFGGFGGFGGFGFDPFGEEDEDDDDEDGWY
jgi:tetratricopeptide (TPR) repeat protein